MKVTDENVVVIFLVNGQISIAVVGPHRVVIAGDE